MEASDLWFEGGNPLPPMFLVNADSKEFTDADPGSADSTGVAGGRLRSKDGETRSWLVYADCKGFTPEILVRSDSAGLKVAAFSASWEWLVSADSKGVMGAFCL